MISEYLQPIAEFITSLILQFGYWGIIFATIVENIIAPIPSEFIFPWAGYLAYQGQMNLFLIALSGAIGSTIAALILYYFGTKFNGPKTRAFVDKYGKYFFITIEDLDKTEAWFTKYGVWTVFFLRMTPIGRTIISVPAGFIKMDLTQFTILTFAGTFLWCFILSYAGYIFGSQWEKVSAVLAGYEHLVVYGFVVAFMVFLFFKRRHIPFVGKYL